MRIAAYQGRCSDGRVDENLARVRQVYRQAVEREADFVLFPEAFLCGYGTRELVHSSAIPLSDGRVMTLLGDTAAHETVLLVGLNERQGERVYNTILIAHRGHLLGTYRKTMLTGGDFRQMEYSPGTELPVFEARGVRFGVIVCADSSYIEVAQALWWKGARLLFSPHYNFIHQRGMDEHRLRVRCNHAGTASLLGIPVVRANVVNWDRPDHLGYGDSAIFTDTGQPLIEAGLFTERLIVADLEPPPARTRIDRYRLPMHVRRALAEQMQEAPVERL